MSETDDRDPLAPGGGIDEANEADAAEQAAVLDEGNPTREWYAQLPDDVNEADVVEQRFEVPLDEDDYDR